MSVIMPGIMLQYQLLYGRLFSGSNYAKLLFFFSENLLWRKTMSDDGALISRSKQK